MKDDLIYLHTLIRAALYEIEELVDVATPAVWTDEDRTKSLEEIKYIRRKLTEYREDNK